MENRKAIAMRFFHFSTLMLLLIYFLVRGKKSFPVSSTRWLEGTKSNQPSSPTETTTSKPSLWSSFALFPAVCS